MISLCFLKKKKKKKAREGKKWKEKFRWLDLYIWTIAYRFKKQSVLTQHMSWVKLHRVPLSNWACIQLLKRFSPQKKKKKINRWWEENNSLCNMTCNTKITCIRLSNFCIKIVLYSFKNLPWKYEKTGVPYLTSLHYSHDTNSYAKINRHYEENFDAFKQIYNWSKQPQYNYMHYIDLVKKLK